VLAAQHLLDLGRFDLLFKRIEPALQLAAHVLALLRPIEQHAEVVEFLGERIPQIDVVGDAAAALERLLCLGLIFPEIGGGDARFELVQLTGGV
jgi:hypothetical protein